MKKLNILLIVAILVFVLTGCNKSTKIDKEIQLETGSSTTDTAGVRKNIVSMNTQVESKSEFVFYYVNGVPSYYLFSESNGDSIDMLSYVDSNKINIIVDKTLLSCKDGYIIESDNAVNIYIPRRYDIRVIPR